MRPFALEWTVSNVPVFGQSRKLPGHDFYDTQEEMQQKFQQLVREPHVTQVISYERKDGELQERERWTNARGYERDDHKL